MGGCLSVERCSCFTLQRNDAWVKCSATNFRAALNFGFHACAFRCVEHGCELPGARYLAVKPQSLAVLTALSASANQRKALRKPSSFFLPRIEDAVSLWGRLFFGQQLANTLRAYAVVGRGDLRSMRSAVLSQRFKRLRCPAPLYRGTSGTPVDSRLGGVARIAEVTAIRHQKGKGCLVHPSRLPVAGRVKGARAQKWKLPSRQKRFYSLLNLLPRVLAGAR